MVRECTSVRELNSSHRCRRRRSRCEKSDGEGSNEMGQQ